MFFCKKTDISWVLKRALHAQKIHYTKTIQGNCLPVANLRVFLQKSVSLLATSVIVLATVFALQIPTHQPYSTKFNLYRYIIYTEYPLYTNKVHWGRIYAIFCKKTNYSLVKTNYSLVKTNYSLVKRKIFQVWKPAPRAEFETFEKSRISIPIYLYTLRALPLRRAPANLL